jgi:hypothetical protein
VIIGGGPGQIFLPDGTVLDAVFEPFQIKFDRGETDGENTPDPSWT